MMGTLDVGSTSRRILLRWVAVPAVAAGGCLESVRSRGQVDLSIRNGDNQVHDVLVEITDEETEFRDRFVLEAGERVGEQTVVDPGTYDVTVELDETPEETHYFTMANCEDNTIYVTIDTNAFPTIDQKRCG